MNWKKLLLGGAFLGTFTLGAMFSPIGDFEAATRSNQNLPIIETAIKTDNFQAKTDAIYVPNDWTING